MIIVAVDDEKIALEGLVEAIKKAAPDADVYGFRDANQAVDFIKDNSCDVAFLDIEMPGMDGFMAAEQLNQLRNKPLLIFTTGFDHLVYDSFQYRPFWFLRKGHLSELSQIVKKAIDVRQHERRYYEINSNGEMYRFPITEILYFESDKHYSL